MDEETSVRTKVIYIDHYDSFANLIANRFQNAGADIIMLKSDCDISRIAESDPDMILLGPGHSAPEDAGNYLDVIREFKARKPIVGICLGFQAIVASESGRIKPLIESEILHGESEHIIYLEKPPFVMSASLGDISAMYRSPANFARYNSLGIHMDELPDSLEMLASNGRGYVMAVKHKQYDMLGFQFHPESHLSGDEYSASNLIANILKMYGR
ncbi:aminodeoxychorismate/anthranilate synthase component II [Candidatus Woesearchaeota archaeon]|nr:aminodeoxychorismate/anthranilate synthase component II [Candidatus Woesearchaeota archaeon]